ncbi:MAG: peroxiredoxin [Acidobacteriota bacterium]
MIQVGERIPQVNLWKLWPDGVRPVPSPHVFSGRKVVVFGLPGAFTPTCSEAHLPGYVARADELRGKGIEAIVCVAPNDAYVMAAWAKTQKTEGVIDMLADGNGDFTRALGLERDMTGTGLGIRMRRFAAIVEDGVVRQLFVEPRGGITVSGVEHVLAAL